MPSFCSTCGRRSHKGLCDMITVSEPGKGTRAVHASRVDSGDLKQDVADKRLLVVNRWIKKERDPAKPKKKARKS